MATILLFMVPPPFYGLGPTWDFCGTQSYLRPWSTVNNKSFRLRLSDLNEAARAADAGPRQIECREGLAPGCAGTAKRSTEGHSALSDSGFCEKMWKSEPPRKPQAQIC